MSKDPHELKRITEALRLLGNPYAKLQILDDEDNGELEPTSRDFHPLTLAESAYVRMLENPYASLSVATEIGDRVQSQQVSKEIVSGPDLVKFGVSQQDFQAECRRIFGQYIPTLEKSRLRPHHKAFITRNRSQSPAVRYGLLEGLRKYDLSKLQGIQVQFNREREDLTLAKLDQIERAVIRNGK